MFLLQSLHLPSPVIFITQWSFLSTSLPEFVVLRNDYVHNHSTIDSLLDDACVTRIMKIQEMD